MLVEHRDADHLGAAVAIPVVDIRDGLDDLGRVHRRAARTSATSASMLRRYAESFSVIAARYFAITRSGSPRSDHPPVVEPQDAVADRLHVADRVRDEQDGDAARAQLVDLAHAALAEVDVARPRAPRPPAGSPGSTLIATANASRTTMPLEYVFTGWSMKSPISAKAAMSSIALVDLPLAEARGSRRSGRRCRARVNSGLKPAPSSSSAATRPWITAVPEVGCRMPGDDLQQRALARPVLADDAEGLAAFHVEADVVQRPKILMALQAVERQQFLQPVARLVVNRVAFGDSFELDGVHNQQSSVSAPLQ